MDKVVERPAAAVADIRDGGRRVVALMEHVTKDGSHKLLERCTPPLTGKGVVDQVVTGLAVLAISPDGFALRELAPGVTVEQVRAATGAPVRTDD